MLSPLSPARPSCAAWMAACVALARELQLDTILDRVLDQLPQLTGARRWGLCYPLPPAPDQADPPLWPHSNSPPVRLPWDELKRIQQQGQGHYRIASQEPGAELWADPVFADHRPEIWIAVPWGGTSAPPGMIVLEDPQISGAELPDLMEKLHLLAEQLGLRLEQIEREQQGWRQTQRQRTRWRYLWDNTLVGIYRSRWPDGLILDINARCLEMLGYTAENQVAGIRQAIDFYDDPQERQEIVRLLQEQGQIHNREIRLRRRDGTRMWGFLSIYLNREEGCVDGILADISSIKRTEIALRASQAELQAVFNAMTDLVLVIDDQGRYVKIPAGDPKTLIRPAEDVIGRTIHELFPTSEADRFLAAIHEALRGEAPVWLEYSLVLAGELCWFEATLSRLSDRSVVWVARDITQAKRAEIVLRQAEENYRSIFENALEGVFQTSPEGRYLRANPALAEIYGYGSPQALLEELTDIAQQLYVDPQRRAAFIATLEQEGEVHGFESQIRRRDGSVRWISESARAIRSPGGEVICFEGFVQDITSRKQAEEALRQQEELLHLALETARMGAWDLNVVTNEERWTRGNRRLFGISDDLILSYETFLSRVHPEDRERVMRIQQEALTQRKRYQSEFRIVGPGGEIRWLACQGTHQYDDSGQPTRLVGITVDITERQEAEQALRASEERFRTLFENAPTGIYRLGLGGEIMLANPMMTQMVACASLAGLQAWEWNTQVQPGTLTRQDLRQRILQQGEIRGLEIDYTRADGVVISVRENARLVVDEAGRPLYIEGTLEDITDRKRAEQALHRSEAKNRAILDAIPDLILRISGTGEYLECIKLPDSFQTPFAPQDYLGRSVQEVMPGELAQLELAMIQKTLQHQEPQVYEFTVDLSEGVRYCETRLVVFGPDQVLALVRDISDRKRAELEQERTLGLLEATLNSTADGILALDHQGQTLIYNHPFLQIWGIESEVMRHRSPIRLLVLAQQTTDPAGFLERVNQIIATPDHSYDIVQLKDGRRFERYSQPQRLGNRQIGRVWNYRDITERQRIENALRESEARLQRALIAADMTAWDWDLVRDRLHCWPDLGEGGADLDYGPSLRYIHPDDRGRVQQAHQQAIQQGGEFQCEYRLLTPAGQIRWVTSRGELQWEGSNPIRMVGASVDITERKRAEQALHHSEAKNRAIIDAIPDLMIRISRSGTYLECVKVPETFQTLADPKEYLGQSVDRVMPADLAEMELAFIERAIQTQSPQIYEYSLDLPQGIQHCEVRLVVSGPDQVLALVRDISDRKRAELEQERTLSLLRATLDATADSIIAVDDQGGTLTFNRQFLQMWNLSSEVALIRETRRPLITQQLKEPEEFTRRIDQITATDQYSHDLFELKDGRIFERHSQPQRIRGQKLGRVWSYRDITERQRIEIALRETEERLQRALTAADMTAWDWDLIENRELCWPQPFGAAPGPCCQPFDQVHPEDREWVEQVRRQAIQQGTEYHCEYRVVGPDGQIRWVTSRGELQWDDQGCPIRMLGASVDITERKQVEEALQLSEARYLQVINTQTEMVHRCRPDFIVTFANQAFSVVVGRPVEDLVGRNLFELVLPEEQERVQAHFLRLTPEQPLRVIEEQSVLPDGRICWRQWTDQALFDEQGQLLEYQCVGHDITERRLAEEALRLSEARYRQVINTQTEFVLRLGPDYHITFTNQAFSTLTGLSVDQLVGRNLMEVILLEKQEQVRGKLLSLTPEQPLGISEEQIMAQGGELRWLQWTDQALFDEEGTLLEYQSVGHDITERRLAEEALRASETKFRNLFENSQVGIFRSGLESGELLDANQRLLDMFGYDSAEQVIRHLFARETYVVDQQRQHLLALLEEREEASSLEIKLKRRDGSNLWVLLSARLNEEEACVEGILTDITERKLQEEALRLMVEETSTEMGREFFRACVQYMAEVLQVPYALVASFADENQSWIQVLAFWQRGASIQNVEYHLPLSLSHPDTQADHLRHLFNTHPDLVHLGVTSCVSSPLIGSQGRPLGVLAVLDTKPFDPQTKTGLILKIFAARAEAELERSRVEADLRRAKETAELANKAKSTFLANMSHELRTPMNAILGYSQLMARDPDLTPKLRESLGVINRSGEHLLNLINTVLELSKIEAGRMALQVEPFNLHQLLQTVQELFRPRIEAKGLHLLLEIAEEVPLFISTDQSKLRQVLINLLGNAVKFTHVGQIAIRVAYEMPLEDEHRLMVEVEDTGEGIAPGEMEALFQPFMQTQSGSRNEGTGLGLSISRQFIQLMGGEIEVSSQPGQGSTFAFDIEVELSDPEDVPRQPSYRRVIGLAPHQPLCRILVVDDLAENRDLLTDLLSSVGFETLTADHGLEAIEAWEMWRPHLIWMDMRMPVMDGYEATRRIKASPQGGSTVIIALTASSFEHERARVLEAGCDDFVPKPFREEMIFERISTHLGVKYLYEDGGLKTERMEARATPPLQPEDLQIMTPDWIEALQEAASQLDRDRVLTLVEQIPEPHQDLAEGLREWVSGFRFDRILDLAERC